MAVHVNKSNNFDASDEYERDSELKRNRRLLTNCVGDMNEAKMNIQKFLSEIEEAEIRRNVSRLKMASFLITEASERHENIVSGFQNDLARTRKWLNFWATAFWITVIIAFALFHHL